MEETKWISDFLKTIVYGMKDPSKGEIIKQEYSLIKSDGKIDWLWEFLEGEYEKEMLFELQIFLYKVTYDLDLFIRVTKTSLEIEYEKKDDVYTEINLFHQISSNQFRIGKYDFMYEWKWNQYLQEKMEKKLNVDLQPIPIEERDKNLVILVMQVFLGEDHAPTRLTLELARIFMTVLKKKVFLLVTYLKEDQERLKSCGLDEYPFEMNYLPIDGKFTAIYKNLKIPGYQIPLHEEREQELTMLLKLIYESKPWLVWNLGASHYYAGLMSKFTTYAYTRCVSGYPAVNADIIVNYIPVSSEKAQNQKEFLVEKGVQIIETEFLFEYDKPNQPVSRSQYSIPENAFCIGIVGNRLMVDMDDNFMKLLKIILNQSKDIYILFYGEISDSFIEQHKKIIGNNERCIFLGTKLDLINYLVLMDVFLNPPRLGGGNGAAMAMSIGKPVITLDKGDVSVVAGAAFNVAGLDEIPRLIHRYQTDLEFRENQGKLAKNKINQMVTGDTELGDILADVLKTAGEVAAK